MNVLSSWINPVVYDNTHDLKKQFSLGTPFPHVVIHDFLQEQQAEHLCKSLQQETFTRKESDLFSLNQTVDFSGSKHETLKSFYLCAGSKEFAEFMHQLTGLAVTPGALDLAGSLYGPGDYLLCHDDQVEDRKIAYVLYLSKGFSDKDGAEFVLFNNVNKRPTTVAHRYLPLWNSLLVFEVSPVSFHMVAENCSTKPRYAIGGWLH